MDISDQMSDERYPVYAALAEKLYRHLQVGLERPWEQLSKDEERAWAFAMANAVFTYSDTERQPTHDYMAEKMYRRLQRYAHGLVLKQWWQLAADEQQAWTEAMAAAVVGYSEPPLDDNQTIRDDF